MHVTQKDFVQELVKLIGPKNDPPTAVQEKVLSLIQVSAFFNMLKLLKFLLIIISIHNLLLSCYPVGPCNSNHILVIKVVITYSTVDQSHLPKLVDGVI